MYYLEVLKAELLTGHPTTGAYSPDDAVAAEQVMAVNQPGLVPVDELIKFLLLDNVYQTDGEDVQDRAIWTRLNDVTKMAVTPTGAVANPWGSTSIGTITEIQQIKTGQLLEFFTISGQGNLPVNLLDSNFQSYVAGATAAGCMSAAQQTALLGMSDNRQSRADVLSLGNVVAGTVTSARAL